MTTINYTADRNVQVGYVKVEWVGLASGDDGQPFDAAGLELASYHAFGTFSGSAKIEGSNELAPADFREMINIGNPEFGTMGNAAHFAGAIRPHFPGGGSGTLSMALLFIDRR